MTVNLERLPKSVELVVGGSGPVFRYVDERKLPGELVIEETRDWRAVVDAIRKLAVRGAPAIGIAGAAALALWASESADVASRALRADELSDPAALVIGTGEPADAAAADAPSGERAAWRVEMADVAHQIATARPTAVNLSWAVMRACEAVELVGETDRAHAARVLAELVVAMQEEDERVNRAIGAHGAELLGAGTRVLTHCNAGSLATGFFGTALGVVYAAAAQGKIERVYADETRPVGQGARLTTWELARAGVPVTLICDNMAASLMAQGKVDAVIVGADRIAANGDTANKIGTYGVAVLAREHGIPFYVAAPTSSVDATLPTGAGIAIEQRSPREVLPEPIDGVDVWNPAFDVTPARYITKIITEHGAFAPGDHC